MCLTLKHCFCVDIVIVIYRCGICNYVTGRNESRLRLYVQRMWSVGFLGWPRFAWVFSAPGYSRHTHRTTHLLWALPLSQGKSLGTHRYIHTCSLSLSLARCSRHSTKHGLSFFFYLRLFQGPHPTVTFVSFYIFFPPEGHLHCLSRFLAPKWL